MKIIVIYIICSASLLGQGLTREEVMKLRPLLRDKEQILDDEFDVKTEDEASEIALKFLGKKYGIRDSYLSVKDVYLSALAFPVLGLGSNKDIIWCVETSNWVNSSLVDVAYVNPISQNCVVIYGDSMKADFKKKSLDGAELIREPGIDRSSAAVEISSEKYAVSSSEKASEIAYPLFLEGKEANVSKDKPIRAYPISAPVAIPEFCQNEELVWAVEIGVPGKVNRITAVAWVHPLTEKCLLVYGESLKVPNP